MSEPVVAQKAPYPVEVAEGQRYFWCSFGRSQAQPFCDGSHKDTGMAPIAWSAKEDKTLYFCGCKHSAGAPFCDGAHAKL